MSMQFSVKSFLLVVLSLSLKVILFLPVAQGASLPSSKKTISSPLTVSMVEAVVNKDVITSHDVDARIKLILLTSGMENTSQEAKNIRAQVIDNLIVEKLQLQAAKSKGINVSEAQLKEALQQIAKDNTMSLEQLEAMLRSNGIPLDTLARRIKAQLAWIQYVRKVHGDLVDVSESEIEAALKKLETDKNQEQVQFMEIFLSVDRLEQESKIRQDAERLCQQLRSGAHFRAVAQQFSQAPSARNGGVIGWMSKSQLSEVLAAALDKMQPGDVSSPIRTPAGFYILQLVTRRRSGEADPGETKVSFCQAILPLDQSTSQEKAYQISLQAEVLLQAKDCSHFITIAESQGAKLEQVKEVALNHLPRVLQKFLQKTAVGKCTPPAVTPQGVLVTMLCSRQAAVLKTPTRQEISETIEQEKLSKQASKDLRRLRSVAYIKYSTKSAAEVSPASPQAADETP